MGISRKSSTGPVGLTLKAWALWSTAAGVTTLQKSANVTSVVRTATGTWTVTFTVNLTGATYVARGTLVADDTAANTKIAVILCSNRAVGSCRITSGTVSGTASAADDNSVIHVEFWE